MIQMEDFFVNLFILFFYIGAFSGLLLIGSAIYFILEKIKCFTSTRLMAEHINRLKK